MELWTVLERPQAIPEPQSKILVVGTQYVYVIIHYLHQHLQRNFVFIIAVHTYTVGIIAVNQHALSKSSVTMADLGHWFQLKITGIWFRRPRRTN